jgi:hypothetical protein
VIHFHLMVLIFVLLLHKGLVDAANQLQLCSPGAGLSTIATCGRQVHTERRLVVKSAPCAGRSSTGSMPDASQDVPTNCSCSRMPGRSIILNIEKRSGNCGSL